MIGGILGFILVILEQLFEIKGIQHLALYVLGTVLLTYIIETGVKHALRDDIESARDSLDELKDSLGEIKDSLDEINESLV